MGVLHSSRLTSASKMISFLEYCFDTFIKRYKLVEKHLIEFSALAMQRQDFKKTDDMFNRVLGKDHLAVICLFEDKISGTRLIVANAHIHWDDAYRDVKLVQVALLVEEVEKIAHHFAKYPPPPPPSAHLPPTPSAESSSSSSVANGTDELSDAASTNATSLHEANGNEASSSFSPSSTSQSHPPPQSKYRPPPLYTDGSKIPLIICGDFNSQIPSGVFEFLNTGSVPPSHPDFMSHTYGRYTSEGIRHRLGMKSAYSAPGAPAEQLITNHTPSFKGHIDYVWYSAANMAPNKVLGEIEHAYLDKVVGFPNPHFPSEYVCCFRFLSRIIAEISFVTAMSQSLLNSVSNLPEKLHLFGNHQTHRKAPIFVECCSRSSSLGVSEGWR